MGHEEAVSDGDTADDDWFNDDLLSEEKSRRSEARRSDPVGCVAELVQAIFEHNTEEEARQLLRYRVGMSPSFGADILACLDTLVADPPSDLAAILRDRAGLYLYRGDDSATPYGDQETLEWLREMAAECRHLLEDAESSQEGHEDEGESQP